MIKKIVINIFIVLFLFIVFPINKSYALPSYEFIPKGINYIDPDNTLFTLKDEYNQGNIYSISPFRVNGGCEYIICSYDYQDVFFLDAHVYEYNSLGKLLGEVDLERFYDTNYLRFFVSSSTYYVSFSIDVCIEYGSNIKYYDIRNEYIMFSSDSMSFDDFTKGLNKHYNDYLYQGYDLDTYEILDKSYNLKTKLSNPISLSKVDEMIYAFDNTDGNISNQKEVVYENYSARKNNEYGSYLLKYTVKNSNNLITTLLITIEVVDDIYPVIYGDSVITFNTNSLLTLEEIISRYQAIDNSEYDISDKIYVISDEYSDRTTRTGLFTILLGVKDDSGNESNIDITINVLEGDTTPPIITGPNELIASRDILISDEEILAMFNASDETDGNITDKLVIDSFDYQVNYNKIGEYKIYVSVKDRASNETKVLLKVLVKDNTPPTFLINSVYVYTLVNANSDVNDIISYLKRFKVINGNNINIIEENYSENKNTPGEYLIKLECDDIETDIILNVSEEQEPIKKGSWIKRLFNNLYSSIKRFFQRLFS